MKTAIFCICGSNNWETVDDLGQWGARHCRIRRHCKTVTKSCGGPHIVSILMIDTTCFIPLIGWKFDASMHTSVRCIGEINRWIKQHSHCLSPKLILVVMSYSTPGPVSAWMGDRLWAGKLSRYVTGHPGQLSLAIPSWVGEMSTSLGWEGNRRSGVALAMHHRQ